MIAEKHQLNFRMVGESPAIDSDEDLYILSHFLMYWDNPISIVNDLLPLVNRGLNFGTCDRWKAYEEIPGLKEKMFSQWEAHNISNPIERWEKLRSWKGYFIEEEDSFLEGVGADVVGSAFVTADTTIMSGSELNFKDLELSSHDFKELVFEWLRFILNNKLILPKPVDS